MRLYTNSWQHLQLSRGGSVQTRIRIGSSVYLIMLSFVCRLICFNLFLLWTAYIVASQ